VLVSSSGSPSAVAVRCAGLIVIGPAETGAMAEGVLAVRRRMALSRADSSRGGQGFGT
jgi:hypothetical protein